MHKRRYCPTNPIFEQRITGQGITNLVPPIIWTPVKHSMIVQLFVSFLYSVAESL